MQSKPTHKIKSTGRLVTVLGAADSGSTHASVLVPFTENELRCKKTTTNPWHMYDMQRSNLVPLKSGFIG